MRRMVRGMVGGMARGEARGREEHGVIRAEDAGGEEEESEVGAERVVVWEVGEVGEWLSRHFVERLDLE